MLTAVELVERLRKAGVRIHRMREPGRVFCLTDDPKIAAWLQANGGSTHVPPGLPPPPTETTPPGGYIRARGGRMEWDIWIHNVPVVEGEGELGDGPRAIWKAAGR